MSNLLERLEKHLKETSKEVLDKEFQETYDKYGDIGPTVEEYTKSVYETTDNPEMKIMLEKYIKPESILCAAIHYDNGIKYPNMNCYGISTGFVLCGYRHHNIISVLPTNPAYKTDLTSVDKVYSRPQVDGSCIQGFITSRGRFVNREEAAEIALDAGQINTSKKLLYSEDLY